MKRTEQRSIGSATRLRFESLESRRLLAAVTAPTVSAPVISLGLSDAPTIVVAPALAGGNLVNASPAGQTPILDIGLNQVFSYSIGNSTTNFDYEFAVLTSDGLSALRVPGDSFYLSRQDAGEIHDQTRAARLGASNLKPASESLTIVEEFAYDSTVTHFEAYSGVEPSRTLPKSGTSNSSLETTLAITSRPLQQTISVKNLSGAPLSTAPTLDIAVNESQAHETPLTVTDLPQSSDLVDLPIEAAMELQASGNQVNSMSSFRVEPVMARHHRIELNQVATEVRTVENATKPVTDANAKTTATAARSATVSTASHRDSTDARMATSQSVRGIPRDHQVNDNVRLLQTACASNNLGAVNFIEGGEVASPQTVDGSNAVAVPILTTEESVISTELGTPLSSDQPREDWERAVEVVMAITVGAVVWTQQQRESEEASTPSLRRV